MPKIKRTTINESRKNQKGSYFCDSDFSKKKIEDVDFSYSIFKRCYFKKAQFSSCKFVGARFYDCNFRSCSISNSDFKYSIFKSTIIPFKEIIANLPKEHNLRRDLLKILRKNASDLGEYFDEKEYIIREIDSHKDYLRSARKKEDDYYRKKYPGPWNTLKFSVKSMLMYIENIAWGHGERPLRSIPTLIIIWFFFISVCYALLKFDRAKLLR